MDFHGIRLPDKEEVTTPGRKLSQGEHANVYEWGKDKVIKIFKASYPIELIDAEYYNALAVKQLPFKKSIPVELKKTEFGFGIVYEKAEGESLTDYIARTSDLKGAATMMAELQRSINKITLDPEKTSALETAHSVLRRKMVESSKADSSATQEMIRFLGTMKDGNSLCHGNLSIGNVFVTKDGPVAMSAAGYCIGKPLYDIAKAFYLIAYTPLPGEETGENCVVCGKTADTGERKEFGRYYLDAMGKTATEIGGYLSMIIAGL